MYWTWLSRHRTHAGRRCVSRELRDLIFRMVADNRTWGAPRIHGELMMLGFDLSERTVLRWMRRAPRNPEPAKRWAAFLNNHREAIAAMDFFTVPTLTFGVLHCFFVIAHERRHPTQADELPQPLAERCCRTLGWELQTGFARSCHRAQRTASETADDRLRSLLPRGSDAPRAGEENACGSGGSGGYRCDLRSLSHAESRWPPPSLQPGRLSIDLGG